MTVVYFPKDYPIQRKFYRNCRYIEVIDNKGNITIQQVFLKSIRLTNSDKSESHIDLPSAVRSEEKLGFSAESILSENHQHTLRYPVLFYKIRMCLNRDILFESVCFAIGFIFLSIGSGVSCLRVFRLFRYFSYLKVCIYIFKRTNLYYYIYLSYAYMVHAFFTCYPSILRIFMKTMKFQAKRDIFP